MVPYTYQSRSSHNTIEDTCPKKCTLYKIKFNMLPVVIIILIFIVSLIVVIYGKDLKTIHKAVKRECISYLSKTASKNSKRPSVAAKKLYTLITILFIVVFTFLLIFFLYFGVPMIGFLASYNP